jgi:hypothetical protein
MSLSKNTKQQKIESALRKPARKAPGTRVGSLEDWREGSIKSGRRGNTLRDGR